MIDGRHASVVAAALVLGIAPGSAGRAWSQEGASAARGVRIERFEWAKGIDGAAPIRGVEVHNDYGDIRARFTQDRRLEAFAVIQRLDPGPHGVGVTVERRGSVVALTVAYPPGRVQDADPDPPKDRFDRLDLTVFVPEAVALGARTLRGMVEARGLKSPVTAATVAGPISVTTTGAVWARTASGDITALLGLVPGAPGSPARPLVFESETGAISVTLPAGASLELRAETSGAFSSDFTLKRHTLGARTRAEGTLGQGGPPLILSSETGRIQLLRADP